MELIFSLEGILQNAEKDHHHNYEDDDDDGYEDDDDDDGYDDDDEGDKSSDDDDDDNFNNYFWNRQMETLPFKVIQSKQSIQVFSANQFKIIAIKFYGINSDFHNRFDNYLPTTELHLPIQNSNCQLGILKVYLRDEKGKIMEFNRKIIVVP